VQGASESINTGQRRIEETMTMSDLAIDNGPGAPGLLDRAHIVAKPGFNRWLVPPAALAIHLCIGMIYGFSVFWLPLSHALGGTRPASCAQMTLTDALVTTNCNWRVTDLGWTFTLAIVFLGASAALFGGWLERVGPRKAGTTAAALWCGGLLVSALGIYVHQLWLVWLGAGVIGGIGLGIGYITPVSTLIKWFPDRRGVATGMAIMGFGGGAMIGSPLAVILMSTFRTADAPGVWQTFAVLAALYAVFMLAGAFGFRVAPAGWAPAGYTAVSTRLITTRNVVLPDAHRTPQFWLVWAVLCLNVSAGIGVLDAASPMLQDIFGGSLIGHPEIPFTALDPAQRGEVAALAAGFVALLSLFNIGGRFFWASLSDRIGRKATYATVFLLGIALYAATPALAHAEQRGLFVLAFCVILSMYGGGFATVPAYLADLFGTRYVGAIHGRLLTAWSTAGVIGPVLVNYIRQAEIEAGVPHAQAYDVTLYVLAGLLALGFLANLAVRPVAERWFMREADPALESRAVPAGQATEHGTLGIAGVLAWAAVGLPILWGVWRTLSKAWVLLS
jgi:MFS family permease